MGSFVKIIIINKTCKNHKLLLVTKLICCNDAQTNGKTRAMLTSLLAYKNIFKKVITAAVFC